MSRAHLGGERLDKYYAVRYTSPPAARLLAGLVVGLSDQLACRRVTLLYGGEPLRVADFACGSGVLLSAIYEELKSRGQAGEGGADGEEEGTGWGLHRYLVEEGLWGFDVERRALQSAFTALSMHEPEGAIERSRLYLVQLGARGGEAPSLGSLSLLRSSVLRGVHPVAGGGPSSVEVPSFHLIVMNPPFTRNVGGNLIFGDLPSEERARLRGELRRLVEAHGLRGAGQGGLASAFMTLADAYLEEGGRMAMILPKALMGGVSWREIRRLLLERYQVEVVVSSFEGPDGWSFSEKTSLSEILLLAYKRTEMEERRPGFTLFVNLWRRPRSEEEATALASLLLEVKRRVARHELDNPEANIISLHIWGSRIGEAYAAKLEEADFAPYQLFAQGELNRAALLLRRGTLYLPGGCVAGSLPLAPLSCFVERIGPDVRQVHEAMQVWRLRGAASLPEPPDPASQQEAFPALWNHRSSRIGSILQEPNAMLRAREGRAEYSQRLWRRGCGWLLVAERAWLATVRVLSIITTIPVLSNVWWPMKPAGIELRDGTRIDAEQVGKLLALWLNSTPGILLLLSMAEVTRGPWVKFKKTALRRLPVLNLSQLDEKGLRLLLECYSMVYQHRFRPLPEEFASPELRRHIDQTLVRALGLKVNMEGLYRLLARDPTVTSHPLS